MTPERRLEALGRAPATAREALADRILADGDVRVVDGPEVATAGVRLAIPGTDSTFVVGRVVVTTCQVTLDGVRGDGAVQGRELRGALAAAICDAECERGGALAVEVDELARRVERDMARELRVAAHGVAQTRLDDHEPGA